MLTDGPTEDRQMDKASLELRVHNWKSWQEEFYRRAFCLAPNERKFSNLLTLSISFEAPNHAFGWRCLIANIEITKNILEQYNECLIGKKGLKSIFKFLTYSKETWFLVACYTTQPLFGPSVSPSARPSARPSVHPSQTTFIAFFRLINAFEH